MARLVLFAISPEFFLLSDKVTLRFACISSGAAHSSSLFWICTEYGIKVLTGVSRAVLPINLALRSEDL